MDFFKSVFSDPTPDPSPPSSPEPSQPSSPIAAPRNPETAHSPRDSSWPFGSTIFRTLATKSESLIDNYYKDLQELGSGLKKETSVIRQVAARAVHDLPARLESGAAIAQESLEAVGQAIDNVGSTVSEIIGKDLNFASNDNEDDNNSNARISNSSENAKPYSRIEAIIRSMQCDIRTYCDEIDEIEKGYEVWKMGFNLEEKRDEIEQLVNENSVIKDIYDEIVPVKVDEGTFWYRYFYRVDKVVKAEEARARIVKRAILDEEEELGWDFDDDEDDNENGKGIENCDNEGVGVSGTKIVDEEEKLVDNEKEVSSDGRLGSDISIISSQRTSHAEDDLGWDEIEDNPSGDEGKKSSSSASNAIDLKKGFGSAEEEELTWDIEDDDDEPVKL
ncbi:hypothetical protein CASFOL_029742 [Castilleja foliolosa]|uniref:BSD domain-containing protein n=1 Tax=Castilleja foliolosa TaxID=1961234 RepID=A0ABD3C9G3_9LAMI